MKKLLVIMLVVVAFAMSVFAIDDPKNGVTTQVGESGKLTETAAQTAIAVEGGNVTTLNISTTASTSRWQGFVGNVSGSLALGKGTDILINFGEAEFSTVFATTTNALDWANLVAGAAADVDTAWGFAAGVDRAVDAFDAGAGNIEGISVPRAELGGSFFCGIFNDGNNAVKNDFAFGAQIETAKAGYDGGVVEYELIVPTEDDSETYYFYLSLA